MSFNPEDLKIYTQGARGEQWLRAREGQQPLFACILGFTETGLIEGISAAGATPEDRRYTAIADAEFLINGVQPDPTYPLPPLTAGASPVLISRAAIEGLKIPVSLFNAGLPIPPTVPYLDLGGVPARCLSTGQALPLATVAHLFEQGLQWGEKLTAGQTNSYLIIGECVVGGTTTALAVLTALGIAAKDKVNSSHRQCNHGQKWQVVQEGLQRANLTVNDPQSIMECLAALGDPMQPVAVGMAIAASRFTGVLLAGGTQMLAVYALMQSLASVYAWDVSRVVVGTTRWVMVDPSGDTVGLALELGEVPLLATQLDFSSSRYQSLRAYEQGYVKEGVGAGGCAIAVHLQGWTRSRLGGAIEGLASRLQQFQFV